MHIRLRDPTKIFARFVKVSTENWNSQLLYLVESALARAGTWQVVFRTGRAGKKRNVFFNGRDRVQKKEDE